VVETRRREKGSILFEQRMHGPPLVGVEDRLPNAQCEVRLEREGTLGLRSDDASDLLEALVGVGELARLVMPLPEAAKVAEGHGSTARDPNGLQELAVAKKVHRLRLVFVTMRKIECPGAVRQIGGLRDVEEIPLDLSQLLKCERGLAAPCRPHEE